MLGRLAYGKCMKAPCMCLEESVLDSLLAVQDKYRVLDL